MSWELLFHTSGFEAAEDLSDYRYHFVVHNSRDQVRLPDSATEFAIGVLQDESSEQYSEAPIVLEGITKVVAGEALAVGDYVKPEYIGAADAGKAVKCSPADANCRGIVLEAAAAEDELAVVWLINPGIGNPYNIQSGAAATVATAGAATYTAAQLLNGLILRDPAGAARSDVTPTAALIIAAMGNVEVGDHFEFTIRNTADDAETITVTEGTGVTLSGTMTIAQNNSKRFRCEVTAATTVTIYSLGTVVH